MPRCRRNCVERWTLRDTLLELRRAGAQTTSRWAQAHPGRSVDLHRYLRIVGIWSPRLRRFRSDFDSDSPSFDGGQLFGSILCSCSNCLSRLSFFFPLSFHLEYTNFSNCAVSLHFSCFVVQALQCGRSDADLLSVLRGNEFACSGFFSPRAPPPLEILIDIAFLDYFLWYLLWMSGRNMSPKASIETFVDWRCAPLSPFHLPITPFHNLCM